MSWPAWEWPGRDSPKVPVTVPDTGVAILPAPHPPADCTGVLGVVVAGVVGAALGVVVAARLVAASVEVESGAVVAGAFAVGLDAVRWGVEAGVEVEGVGPSSAG